MMMLPASVAGGVEAEILFHCLLESRPGDDNGIDQMIGKLRLACGHSQDINYDAWI
jgi:hypothetical protein